MTKSFTYSLLFAALIVGVVCMLNTAHANRRHDEAPALRAVFRQSPQGSEVYYSPTRGTILALFSIESVDSSPNKMGGIIWRVTENRGNGTVWLAEEAYECSAFIAERQYWNRVVKRDGYFPLVSYPNIQAAYWNWILAQLQEY